MVPLAGLQEMLFLRDSIQIKKQILKDLDQRELTSYAKALPNYLMAKRIVRIHLS